MTQPTPRYRGKKINIVIPIEAYEKITRLAEEQNRPVANLCVALLLERLAQIDEGDRT